MPLRGLFCLRFSISAMALLAGLWPAVAGADTVSIRAGERGQGARLILDWPSPVTHTARLNGQQLTLSFARTVDADVDGLSQRLSGWISSARHSADGKQIFISLKRNVQLSSFAAGKQVVVDLLPELATSPTPPQETRVTPAEKAAPSSALLQVRVGHHRDYNRAVLVLGSNPTVTRGENKITLSVPTSRQLSPAQLAQLRLPQVASVAQSLEQDKLTISFTLKPNTKVSEFNVAKGIGLDFAAAPAAQVAQIKPPVSAPTPVKVEPPKAEVVEPKHEEAAATPAPAPAPVAEPVTPPAANHVEVVNKPDDAPAPQAAPVIKPVEVSSIKDGVLPSLLMSVQPDTPVAVFRRGSALYVVVSNNNTPRELIPLVGSALAATDKVELLPADGGRVVRIDLTGLKTEPQLLPVQGGWSVSFPETGHNDIKPLEVVEDASFSTGARLLVKTQNASNAVTFADPLLGDELIAVPVSSALSGIDHPLRYVQADLMPTLQGIAIKPWADGLTVLNGGNGVEISLRGGMAIAEKLASEITPPAAITPQATPATSPATPAPQGAANPAAPATAEVEQLPTLFDFRSYGKPAGEKFTDQRTALQNEIAKQMPEDTSESWMNFARFYFINGMATEADAIWQSVAARNPDVKDLPDFKLIHAIAAFSSGTEANRDAALAAANQPSSDYALWSGLRAVEKRDWATASDNFKRASERIWEYPEPYRSRLAIGAIEALLNTKDLPLARSLLDKLSAFYTAEGREKTPAMEYMTGILAWNQRQSDQARAHLGSAAQSWNQYWRVRAELALIDADIKDNKLPPDKVLERVDRLRFAWRGDALEFDILHRLAAQHINIGNYAAAFDDYAKLAEKFPNDPRTAGLENEQKDSFTRIFQGPDRDKNQPFSQLAVWEGYPKFRPTQKEVLNGINTYMAERVTSMDLLSRAAEFYNEVLKNTTDPVARAELGVKIAGLYLLDKNSDAAMKALTETEAKVVPGQPSPLSNALRDERRMLNSRALSGLGKVDDALALLNSDYSDPAMRLRVDVNWRAKRWPEAAAQLESLIGPPPANGVALTPQKSALIVSRATALALSGDSKSLRDLRVKFGAAMAGTSDASTFQLLTRPEVAGGLPDRNTLNSRVAEVDLFQKFLERYRSTSSTPAAEAPVASAEAEHH